VSCSFSSHPFCLKSSLIAYDMLIALYFSLLFIFVFNDTATTEIYTLSLHDALPIYFSREARIPRMLPSSLENEHRRWQRWVEVRSEEHTSELQSRENLVCRLLLEKKKKQKDID